MWAKNDCVSYLEYILKFRKKCKQIEQVLDLLSALKSYANLRFGGEYVGEFGFIMWLEPRPMHGYTKKEWSNKLRKHENTFFHVRINVVFRKNWETDNFDPLYQVWFRDEAHEYKRPSAVLKKATDLLNVRAKIKKPYSPLTKRSISVMGDSYEQCPRCNDFNGAGREWCFDCGKTLQEAQPKGSHEEYGPTGPTIGFRIPTA